MELQLSNFFTWDTDPLFIDLGLLKIRWYGLTFAIGFFLAYKLLENIYQKEKKDIQNLEPLLFYTFLGTLIGARLGHCLFYEPTYYLANPIKIIAFWEGGLASHGGAIGVFIAVSIYCKKKKEPLFWVLDRISVAIPVAAAFIRIGNFFNSEIVGTVSNKPWAVIFKRRAELGELPRHPAQLYEAIIYFSILVTLMIFYNRERIKNSAGKTFGILLTLTFISRFFIEFIKINQEKYDSGFLNTGQLLSIPFILIGIYFYFRPSIAKGSEISHK